MLLFGYKSKLLASLVRNNFPKRQSGELLENLLNFYDVPFGFVTPSIEQGSWLICDRRWMAVTRYRVIRLVLITFHKFLDVFFSNKKYDSYKCWTYTELCEVFTFLIENIYVQFEGMVYQQIVGIPLGTNSFAHS